METEDQALQQQHRIAHAMDVLTKVAKLQSKWKPVLFHEGPNRRMRRAFRLARTRPLMYACGTCKLPYVGKDRCQCKLPCKLAGRREGNEGNL